MAYIQLYTFKYYEFGYGRTYINTFDLWHEDLPFSGVMSQLGYHYWIWVNVTHV